MNEGSFFYNDNVSNVRFILSTMTPPDMKVLAAEIEQFLKSTIVAPADLALSEEHPDNRTMIGRGVLRRPDNPVRSPELVHETPEVQDNKRSCCRLVSSFDITPNSYCDISLT